MNMLASNLRSEHLIPTVSSVRQFNVDRLALDHLVMFAVGGSSNISSISASLPTSSLHPSLKRLEARHARAR